MFYFPSSLCKIIPVYSHKFIQWALSRHHIITLPFYSYSLWILTFTIFYISFFFGILPFEAFSKISFLIAHTFFISRNVQSSFFLSTKKHYLFENLHASLPFRIFLFSFICFNTIPITLSHLLNSFWLTPDLESMQPFY